MEGSVPANFVEELVGEPVEELVVELVSATFVTIVG